MEKTAFVAMLQRAGMNFETDGDNVRILGTEYRFDSQGLLLTVGSAPPKGKPAEAAKTN